jgi:competence protein ComEC
VSATLSMPSTSRPHTLQTPHAAKRAPIQRRLSSLSLAFSSAPALVPAFSFALGIALGLTHWLVPAWLLLELPLLAALVLFSSWCAPRALLPALAGLFAVLGCFAALVQPPVDPQTQLAALAQQANNRNPITIVGSIIRVEPAHSTTYTAFFQQTTRFEHEQRFDLQLSSYSLPGQPPIPLQGGLRLSLYTDLNQQLPTLDCGTLARVPVVLRPESRYNDPGVWDVAAYMHTQGIGATSTAPADRFERIGHTQPTLACRLHSLQTTASARVQSLDALPLAEKLPAFFRLNPQDVSILTAMLTGDRTALQQDTRVGFERTGSFHLLVVSGLHLAIFSSVIFLLAGRLRLPPLAATAVTILLSLAYAVFTGFGEPVQRSFWMVTLYLLGRLLYRDRMALQSLAIAALLLLAVDPHALAGSSLQMTLLTVISIAGFAVPFAERTFAPYLHGTRNLWLTALDPSLPPKVAQFRLMLRLTVRHLGPVLARCLGFRLGPAMARRFVPALVHLLLRCIELMLVSAVVELLMALPMAMYFHRVTVLGLPVNVCIIPFLGFLLPAAMLCFAALLVSPALAFVPALCTAVLLHTISAIVTTFAHLPFGDYRLPAPPDPRIVLWLLLVPLGIYLVRQPRRAAFALTCPLLLGLAVLAVAPQPVRHPANALLVSALDVGQGDSILVITPDGKTLLVDAGGIVGETNDHSFDIGNEVVAPALWARGIQHLDAVAITHAHADHIGGIPAILSDFHPKVLLVGNNPISTAYAAILQQAASEHIPVQPHFQGDHWQFGSVTSVQALWPSHSYVPKSTPTNNDSLVLRLAYGQGSALLEGDAEAEAEQGMLAANLTHADLLKVGHHGSSTSSAPAFLAAVHPAFAVISCGRHNFYGHPRPGTLEHLEDAHALTFRTDTEGETDFVLNGTRVTQKFPESTLH